MIKKSDVIVGVFFPAYTSLGLFMAADFASESAPAEDKSPSNFVEHVTSVNLTEITTYAMSALFAIQAINHVSILYSKHKGTWAQQPSISTEIK